LFTQRREPRRRELTVFEASAVLAGDDDAAVYATGIAVTALYDLSGTWVALIEQIDPLPGFWDKFLI
jgi:hypothetical protein